MCGALGCWAMRDGGICGVSMCNLIALLEHHEQLYS